MKRLTILGSTGSIGTQTLEVVRQNPDKLQVYALLAGKNVEEIERQAREFRPKVIGLMDEKAARELSNRVQDLSIEVVQGMEGMLRSVTDSIPDTIVTAISGRIGLEPTLAALQAGKDIALANKETLVAGGEFVMETARRLKRGIFPVDSEHSAIFQCLEEQSGIVEKIILTASGGPFRGWSNEQLSEVTPESALKHPNWAMGAKITIDSATMMNKGLEVIEAHHLFNLNYDEIEVLIHPQSVIHSMVQYVDGSILAQLGRADMRLPILYALSYPTRWPSPFERLNFRGKTLTFFEPAEYNFPALSLAYECGRRGGTLPAVMNAANEVAVHAFLARRIPYLDIMRLVEKVCEEHQVLDATDLESILSADEWARVRTEELIQ